MSQETRSQEPLQTARGMHDVLPGRSEKYAAVENAARRVFALFGYEEIRTPVLEPAALFQRAIGEDTDIVEKEMFTLTDRGERQLCMRPEGTAGVVRSLIENGLDKQSAAVKLFYAGPMFRAERPQKGRFREFVQIGSEYFGNPSPSADAETIVLVRQLLKSFGLEAVETRINSIGCSECRPAYQEKLLQFLKDKSASLCGNCQRRIQKNPLRALDCKEDADKLKDAPKSEDHLCQACADHYKQVKSLLKVSGAAFTVSPGLVRGLDYYSRTVFEFYPADKSGSQDALAAGGRYDSLVEQLGGEKIPAVGFALGLERVLNQIEEQKGAEAAPAAKTDVFVAALGPEAVEKCFEILAALRENGIRAESFLNGQSLKSQMRLADKLGSRFCVIIGENELKDNTAALKDLVQKKQDIVPQSGLIQAVRDSLK